MSGSQVWDPPKVLIRHRNHSPSPSTVFLCCLPRWSKLCCAPWRRQEPSVTRQRHTQTKRDWLTPADRPLALDTTCERNCFQDCHQHSPPSQRLDHNDKHRGPCQTKLHLPDL